MEVEDTIKNINNSESKDMTENKNEAIINEDIEIKGKNENKINEEKSNNNDESNSIKEKKQSIEETTDVDEKQKDNSIEEILIEKKENPENSLDNTNNKKELNNQQKNENQQHVAPNSNSKPYTPWTEHKAPSGEFYYYNHITKQSTWKKPDNYIPFKVPFIPHLQQKHALQKPIIKQEQKPIEKAISMKRIPGTPWHIILTSRNNEFFYNYDTKKSTWEIPEEIKDIINKLLEEAKKIKEEREAALKKKEEMNKLKEEEEKKQKLEMQEKMEIDENKNKEQEEQKEKVKQNEPKSKENQQKSGDSSKEKKIEDFYALLEENKISPFSTWEQELSNIIHDKRYSLIPTLRERKKLFDEYCRKKIEEMKKNNELTIEDPIKKYKKLLKEVVKEDTTWKMFMIRNKRDSRYLNLGAKEREKIFNEYKKELEKSEHQKRIERKEKAKASFMELLKETKEITADSSWRTIKHIINKDERYDLVNSYDREDYFYDYRKSLKKENDKQREEEKALERKKREEISMREREKEVNKEKYYRDKEVKNNRLKTQANYARIQFQSLLIDYIRTHNITWEKKKATLMSDYRWQQCKVLSELEMKSLFDEHIKSLFEKRLKAFNDLLEEVLNKNPVIEWLELYPAIEDDPRVVKLQKEEDELEQLFIHYKVEFIKNVEINFKKLLEENSFIEYQIKQEVINSVNENEAENKYVITIEEIEEIIKVI
ncbi:hypothetical protein BCR36DRAFT_282048 [Piromyces finnis]|uniref:WW domain-containing protein n=1 Tax=Piromyces finnis TaxID=1754191 RepID=A0A1Y1VGR1_9FUNG|nr:hypothetical protein BCR36DRAFT_282048 [Piromyces finnis]|eukprot:ORX55263.1 hypothetical protein BCR36DRAFT_282048 [Piromyces finnis]